MGVPAASALVGVLTTGVGLGLYQLPIGGSLMVPMLLLIATPCIVLVLPVRGK